MGRSVRRSKLPTEPVVTTVESLSHDGRGVAHINGKAVFLHGGLPGEEVQFTYTGKQRRYDEGTVCHVIKASPERVEPRCPHFGVCGGCSLQHMDPAAQILAKQQILLESLRRIGDVTPAEILAPLVTESPWGYRRKARLGVKYVAKKGRVLVGFRERGSSFIADLTRCEVLHPLVGELITPLAEMIAELSIRDRIPQIEVAMGDRSCVLIFRLLQDPTPEDLEILTRFGTQYGVAVYLQPGGPDSVVPITGEPTELSYALPEFRLEIRFLPTDFTQVNSELNRLMVSRAIEMLAPEPEERILDLFCGVGNFTLPLARRCQEVVGVEGDADLVTRARENALHNGLHNLRYYTANLYEPLEKEPWLRDRFDRALLDPPRSGAQEVLAHLPALGIRRIVYVSCYPGTLARDADKLVHQHGYRLTAAGVMDMFPHTAHVESIALFEK